MNMLSNEKINFNSLEEKMFKEMMKLGRTIIQDEIRVLDKLILDYRYSSVLCYNTFPFPKISEAQKQELTQCVFRILEERENHSEKTLAQLYDPEKMPHGLREAHRLNDLAVERCYRSKPFETDEERLEYLFKLYEQMIAEEKTKDTLFQEEKKAKKSKKIK